VGGGGGGGYARTPRMLPFHFPRGDSGEEKRVCRLGN
jgi:hypothetical protein